MEKNTLFIVELYNEYDDTAIYPFMNKSNCIS